MEQNVYTNPNIHNPEKQTWLAGGEGEPSGQAAVQPTHGILLAFVKYAERGSMTGVPYIHQSKRKVVKIIWSCLLLAACACMTFHLYSKPDNLRNKTGLVVRVATVSRIMRGHGMARPFPYPTEGFT
ncbi:hypothetical protein PoB_006200800 [Plakobranchus ocellatus]|uniref:Uncharacterized protein n=1 Tax=Plakobranchus ocellatus TaxID=259542 RepID=A0AAV4CUA9_9GAST|nr:hypothetical protein PoB_006200800 [Plakobranchus ocellatus]